MPDSIIQQINEGGVDQLASPSALQTQVKKNPEMLRDFLLQLFGIKDAVRAYKGEMTEEEAQNFALMAALGVIPMAGELGPAARAAEKVAPEAAQSLTQMIRAYHGSPYDFDKFDLSKIGTGEGAQAYGHGLYFSENPAVAKQYREKFDTKGLPQRINEILEGGEGQPSSKMYEVNINADPEHFLDWDKPLSEQSEHVQSVLKDAVQKEAYNRALASTNKTRADELWSMVKDPLSAPAGFAQDLLKKPEITDQLRQAGIPGIKYLDQGSRGKMEFAEQPANTLREAEQIADEWKGRKSYRKVSIQGGPGAWTVQAYKPAKGTFNYVVFDDKLIDIVKKYGLAGLVAGGAFNFMPKQK